MFKKNLLFPKNTKTKFNIEDTLSYYYVNIKH